MVRIVSAVLALVLLGLPAMAHTGLGDAAGLSHGFVHPIGGVDHVLAMVAVGLFAAHLGGRALWLVPSTFMAMMAVAGALGMTGIDLPLVEIGIGLSVVALGLVIALGLDLPPTAAMALVGVFAIFHGHAHGAEMPDTVSGFSYAVGFVAATALLHAVGIGLGLCLSQLQAGTARRTAQIGGTAMAAVGVALLAGVF